MGISIFCVRCGGVIVDTRYAVVSSADKPGYLHQGCAEDREKERIERMVNTRLVQDALEEI